MATPFAIPKQPGPIHLVAQTFNGLPIFSSVDDGAQFKGGAKAWRKFLTNTVRFFQEAVDKNIQGETAIRFLVDVDGRISDIQVVEGNPVLATEAARVISVSQKKWEPYRVNGKPVKSYKVQEITFRLQLR